MGVYLYWMLVRLSPTAVCNASVLLRHISWMNNVYRQSGMLTTEHSLLLARRAVSTDGAINAALSTVCPVYVLRCVFSVHMLFIICVGATVGLSPTTPRARRRLIHGVGPDDVQPVRPPGGSRSTLPHMVTTRGFSTTTLTQPPRRARLRPSLAPMLATPTSPERSAL